jgi:hypothetical protein
MLDLAWQTIPRCDVKPLTAKDKKQVNGLL